MSVLPSYRNSFYMRAALAFNGLKISILRYFSKITKFTTREIQKEYFYQNQIYNSEIFFIESRKNIWVILEKNKIFSSCMFAFFLT